MMQNPFRQLPSVDLLVQQIIDSGAVALPHHIVVAATRAELHDIREHMRHSADSLTPDAISLPALIERVRKRLQIITAPSLRPVINASGVILQTNLGRAPLSDAALAALHTVGCGYTNLEYDLAQGKRGSRLAHATTTLCHLTGAEAALLVNNNAAALFLVLSTLACGREVIISRGQAVEIGGGFRIPDVLRQSGALVVEVGTTNRTYPHDYTNAITPQTALLLLVHTSNFRISGFVRSASLAEMCTIGREHAIPVVDDLGSGSLLPTQVYGLAPEPLVQESISAGADLVTFSGDKLLGGPQVGIIVGRAPLIAELRRAPLARALRVDKLTIGALEATLHSYIVGHAPQELPVWRMISTPLAEIRARAERIANHLCAADINVAVQPSHSTVGGGSLPGDTLESVAIVVSPRLPDNTGARLAHTLRMGTPAVVPRLHNQQLWFDMRTVLPEQDESLMHCILAATQTPPSSEE